MTYGIILLKIFQACFGALVQRTELILGKTVMEKYQSSTAGLCGSVGQSAAPESQVLFLPEGLMACSCIFRNCSWLGLIIQTLAMDL